MSSDTSPLTVATVLYGGVAVLRETLPLLFRSSAENGVEVIVIDNSPDDVVGQVVRDCAREAACALRYVSRENNPGFAASANEAIRLAATEWVFLVNADVYLDTAAIEAVVAHIDAKQDTRPAAVSLITDGQRTCGVELNWLGYFSDRKLPSSRPCLGPSGGAAVFHQGQFRESGGFKEGYFAWGEDADLALRLWARGVQTSELDLRLSHIGGHSITSLATLQNKARWLARNRVLTMKNECTVAFCIVIGVAQLFLMVLNGVRKIPAHTARAHYAGLAEGLFRRRETHDFHPRFGVRDLLRYHLKGTAASRRSDGPL